MAFPPATPTGDGIQNLMKFATGMDPTKPGIMPGTFTKNGSTLSFAYAPSTGAVADGVTFTVEYSDTLALGSWSTIGVNQGFIGSGGALVTATMAEGANGRRFVRLRVAR